MGDKGIGAMLRQLRAAAWRSQSEQAAVLSELAGRPVTRNDVSRWEHEGRLLTPRWQRAYADSFGVPVEIIRNAVAVSKAQRRQATSVEGDSVQRREFISVLAGLAGALPVHGAYQRIGTTDIQQLIYRTARLRRLDNFLGGSDTYQLYATELAATTTAAKQVSCTETTRRALHTVIAEQAQLAGWAAFDGGLQKQAARHYAQSYQAAKEAGNPALAGNALAFLAYQHVSVDMPNISLAASSVTTAEKGATRKVKALLLERMAWTQAVAGNATATERALAQATAALHMPDDRPEPDWVFWVDDLELQIMTGRCWTELKRPLRAVPTLEAALTRYDNTHARDKALYLTWLAHAYVDAKEIEQAAITIGRALDLSAGVASVRPLGRVRKVVQRLQPHRMNPVVGGVVDRVRGLS